jgi:hypothetical protein
MVDASPHEKRTNGPTNWPWRGSLQPGEGPARRGQAEGRSISAQDGVVQDQEWGIHADGGPRGSVPPATLTQSLYFRVITPDLPPQEPSLIGPAVEIHQPRPAQHPKKAFEDLNPRLKARVRLHSSTLVSVLVAPSGSTAASVLVESVPAESDLSGASENDPALQQAVKVVTESLRPQHQRRTQP